MSVTLEINALDFERLHETSMSFGSDWMDQVAEGRFESKWGMQVKHIYWFENYVSAKMAGAYLDSIDTFYTINFDNVLGQYVILTNYVGA